MWYSLIPLQIGKTCESFIKPSESPDVRHRKLLNTAGGSRSPSKQLDTVWEIWWWVTHNPSIPWSEKLSLLCKRTLNQNSLESLLWIEKERHPKYTFVGGWEINCEIVLHRNEWARITLQYGYILSNILNDKKPAIDECIYVKFKKIPKNPMCCLQLLLPM